MIPGFGRSEVVIIYPDICINGDKNVYCVFVNGIFSFHEDTSNIHGDVARIISQNDLMIPSGKLTV
jgi:hypothetical protein